MFSVFIASTACAKTNNMVGKLIIGGPLNANKASKGVYTGGGQGEAQLATHTGYDILSAFKCTDE